MEEKNKENSAFVTLRAKKLQKLRADLFGMEFDEEEKKRLKLLIPESSCEELLDRNMDEKLEDDQEVKEEIVSSDKEFESHFAGLSDEEATKKLRAMTEAEQKKLQENLQKLMIENTDTLKENVSRILVSLHKDKEVMENADNSLDSNLNSIQKVNTELAVKLKKKLGDFFSIFTLYMTVTITFFLMVLFMKIFPKPQN